jgi:hypothetical protein
VNFLRGLWRLPENRPYLVVATAFGDVGAVAAMGARIMRGRELVESVHHGPNIWSALVTHPDGSYDFVQGQNLLTTAGRDLIAAAYGTAGVNAGGSVAANTATSTSATSLTNTAAAYTTDQFKGWIVMAEDGTNTPVFGNIGSNSATVLTIDSWKNADDSAGNTPGATANYSIYPASRARYMALTTDVGAAAASDTTLASEITTGGCARALATYAHTGSTATYTLQKTYSVTSPFTIHKGALFTAGTLTAGGIMPFEAPLNQDAIVGNLDSLQVTATVTLS